MRPMWPHFPIQIRSREAQSDWAPRQSGRDITIAFITFYPFFLLFTLFFTLIYSHRSKLKANVEDIFLLQASNLFCQFRKKETEKWCSDCAFPQPGVISSKKSKELRSGLGIFSTQQRGVDGKYRCQHCLQPFRFRSRMLKHIRAEHGQRYTV